MSSRVKISALQRTTSPSSTDSVLIVDQSLTASRRLQLGDLPVAGSINNSKLQTGVFANITGLGIQTQSLNMGGTNTVVGLAEPVGGGNAATKRYVDTQIAGLTIPTEANIRTLIQNIAPENIEDLENVVITSPVDGDLIVREGQDYINRGGHFGRITGIGTQTRALNMGGFKISNLATPTAGADAATKSYVDSRPTGSGGSTTLGGLTDVTLGQGDSAPVDGQGLIYDGATSQWVNMALPTGGGGGSGFTLTDGIIMNRHLATNSVSTAKIRDANVTTQKIADKSVSDGKMVGGSYPSITGLGTLSTGINIARNGAVVINADQRSQEPDYMRKVEMGDFDFLTRRTFNEFGDITDNRDYVTMRVDMDGNALFRLGRERGFITRQQVEDGELGLNSDSQAAYHNIEFYDTVGIVNPSASYFHVHNIKLPDNSDLEIGGSGQSASPCVAPTRPTDG